MFLYVAFYKHGNIETEIKPNLRLMCPFLRRLEHVQGFFTVRNTTDNITHAFEQFGSVFIHNPNDNIGPRLKTSRPVLQFQATVTR